MAKHIRVRLAQFSSEDIPKSIPAEWKSNMKAAFEAAIPDYLARFNTWKYVGRHADPAAGNQITGRGISGGGLSDTAQGMRFNERIYLGGPAYLRGFSEATSAPRVESFLKKGGKHLVDFAPIALSATGLSAYGFPSIMAGIINFFANRTGGLPPDRTEVIENDGVSRILPGMTSPAKAALQGLFTQYALFIMAALGAQIARPLITVAIIEFRARMFTTFGTFLTGGVPSIIAATIETDPQVALRVHVV